METIKKAATGIQRMSIVLWCVTAIVVIHWINLYYSQPVLESGVIVPVPNMVSEYVTITAMSLIATLGGVDVLKRAKELKTMTEQK
jgi:hypothetical protein